MADDTSPDDDDRPRRPRNKKPSREDDDDDRPTGSRARRRDREDEEGEWEEDDRPRRRRRRPSEEDEEDYDPALKMVVPLNTSALAIAAGYVGLISVLCIPAPFALLLGILALQHLKKHPKLDGKVRAIFAIVMGVIFSGVLTVVTVAVLLG